MPRKHLTTPQRGYGRHHQRTRTTALRNLTPGTPCPLCGQPMYREQNLDLDHETPIALGGNPHGPRRLTHARCNRQAGARIGQQRIRAQRVTSRRW